MQLKTIKEIQDLFIAKYGIHTVGIGKDSDGNFCLVVLLTSENKSGTSAIPTEFEGVKVLTKVVGRAIAH